MVVGLGARSQATRSGRRAPRSTRPRATAVCLAGLGFNRVGQPVKEQSHHGIWSLGRHAATFDDPFLNHGQKFIVHPPKLNEATANCQNRPQSVPTVLGRHPPRRPLRLMLPGLARPLAARISGAATFSPATMRASNALRAAAGSAGDDTCSNPLQDSRVKISGRVP